MCQAIITKARDVNAAMNQSWKQACCGSLSSHLWMSDLMKEGKNQGSSKIIIKQYFNLPRMLLLHEKTVQEGSWTCLQNLTEKVLKGLPKVGKPGHSNTTVNTDHDS